MTDFRAITPDTPIGTKVLLKPSMEGQPYHKGKLAAIKEGPLFKQAIVEVEGETYLTHISAVGFKPIGVLDGRPVFVGDIMWLCTAVDARRCRITNIRAGRVFNEPVSLDEPNFGTGDSPERHFKWERPTAAASSVAEPDMFINVYSSVPKGERKIPGSTLFASAAAASRARHSGTLHGMYKLVKCDGATP